MRSELVVASLTIAGLLLSRPTRASDTVEVYEPGSLALELYLGAGNLGSDGERDSASELVIGYGIGRQLSAFLASGFDHLSPAGSANRTLSFGLLGTLFDSHHLDLDLILCASRAIERGENQVATLLELNLDRDDQQRSQGSYLRLEIPRGDAPIASTLGLYQTISTDHQLLVEWTAAAEERGFSHQAALGYNTTISDSWELVSQLSMTRVAERAELDFGVTIGLLSSFAVTAR